MPSRGGSCSGSSIVLVGEVRLGETAREQGCDHERNEDGLYFETTAGTPLHRFAPCEGLPIDPVCEDDRRLRDMDAEPPGVVRLSVNIAAL